CRQPQPVQVGFLAEMFADRKSLLGQIMFTSNKTHRENMRRIAELSEKLSKHRKPPRHAERNAEIMRLHDEGKSAGKIARAIQGKFGKFTDSTIRSVIRRELRKRAN